MVEFISSQLFQYFILPLCTTLLSLIIRISTKKDSGCLFRREDFAIGMDISATAIFIILSKCAIVAGNIVRNPDLVQKGSELLIQMLVVSFVLLMGLMAVTTVVRRLGWEQQDSRLKMFWGVIFPNIIGIIYLIIVYSKSIDL